MKPLSPFRKAIVAGAIVSLALLAPASGLISAEAENIIHLGPSRTAGERGKQLATLQSYLLSNPVTVGIEPGTSPGGQGNAIRDGLAVWSDALGDSPFVEAQPGTKPMVVIKFVRNIRGPGDIQGQVEATRYLKWGPVVGYRLEATMLVKETTGDRDLTNEELVEVVAHELGHLLGLDDANRCDGLMGPFVAGSPRTKPSRAEVDAVVAYRRQLRAAIDRLNP